jgi:O-antigen ligase
MQSAIGADGFGLRRLSRQPHFERLPLILGSVLALLLALVVSRLGIQNLTFPVKLAVLGVCAIAAAWLFYARPLLFPLCAWVFAVPFDTLLQTGGGTITKFLGVASAFALILILTDRRRVIGAPAGALLWAAYLAWSLASYIWSAQPGFRNDLLVSNIELFAIFVIASMVRISKRELGWILGAALAGGTAFAAFGVWLFHNAPAQISGATSGRLAIRMNHTAYVNADHFSASLVMPVALAIVGMLHFGGWRKVLFIAALIVLFAGVFVSGTRGSFIAIAVMWAYLLIVHARRLQLALIAGVALVSSLAIPNVWIRFTDPGQAEAGGRFSIWGIAWDAFKHRPLLGIGADQFQIAYSQSYLAHAHGQVIDRWVQDPHNVIVSNAVELGVIGLALILVAWFFQFRIAKAIPRSSPALFSARIAIEAGTLGLFVQALSLDIMFYKYLWVAFILGAFVRSAYLTQSSAAETPRTDLGVPAAAPARTSA